MNASRLRAAIVEQFVPRFAPRAKLIYMKRAAGMPSAVDEKAWKKLGLPIGLQSDLPDMILYNSRRRWLYLVERGPVSHVRHQELEKVLKSMLARRVYVSVFPDFSEFSREGDNIAWETEVWIAEAPDHLIHYDGDKFIGPRHPSKRRVK